MTKRLLTKIVLMLLTVICILNKMFHISKEITEAHRNAPDIRWPPTAFDLQNMSGLPANLTTFLSHVISGKKKTESEHSERLISSIGQVC